MTTPTASLEVWQRGPLPGFDPLLMPVAHSFRQVQEDLRALVDQVSPETVWQRPGGAASIAFHVRHIGGSTDRLLTYARGQSLSDQQRAAARAETDDSEPRPSLAELVDEASAAIDRALDQVRRLPRESLLEARTVGRAELPSNTLGLLFHAAEHATRHAGQSVTMAKILAASA